MKQMKQDDLIQFFIYHYKLINIITVSPRGLLTNGELYTTITST